MSEKKTTVDSKYIQQHLANERTYLAWVRTAIAVIGIGFLITNLHYTMEASFTRVGDLVANAIGLISFIIGIITILVATFSYFRKTKQINDQTFKASSYFVWLLTILTVCIILIFALYLFTFTL
ncbi:DUF202 domain-containing protein [Bacillus tianshenii]|nr:DUF202 domain-containing protein [Bacillus tianshenii]